MGVTLTTQPDPPRMGETTFEATVTQGGQPVTDAAVSVELYMPAMPEMKKALRARSWSVGSGRQVSVVQEDWQGGFLAFFHPPLRLGETVPLLRRVCAPLPPTAYAGVDIALVSHLHLDHFDLPSLRRLGPNVTLVVPAGAGPLLRRAGFTAVRELATGDLIEAATSVTGGMPKALDTPLVR